MADVDVSVHSDTHRQPKTACGDDAENRVTHIGIESSKIQGELTEWFHLGHTLQQKVEKKDE